jgi:hypothetical protein
MDKRDAMTIGASLSGIHLEWIDGVHLSDMSDKSYPAVCDFLVLPPLFVAIIVYNILYQYRAGVQKTLYRRNLELGGHI